MACCSSCGNTVAGNIAVAWILTLPAAAFVGAAMEVSRSGFHAWAVREPSKRAVARTTASSRIPG